MIFPVSLIKDMPEMIIMTAISIPKNPSMFSPVTLFIAIPISRKKVAKASFLLSTAAALSADEFIALLAALDV